MALVLVRYSINGQHGNGRIINTNNIGTIFKLENISESKFKAFLTNGEIFNFNQLYYEGDFKNVYDMYQLYGLLSKLDSGGIKSERET